MDLNSYIISVIINKGIKLSNIFSTKEQIVIPWSKIIKIGNDVIIVDYKKTKKLEKLTYFLEVFYDN